MNFPIRAFNIFQLSSFFSQTISKPLHLWFIKYVYPKVNKKFGVCRFNAQYATNKLGKIQLKFQHFFNCKQDANLSNMESVKPHEHQQRKFALKMCKQRSGWAKWILHSPKWNFYFWETFAACNWIRNKFISITDNNSLLLRSIVRNSLIKMEISPNQIVFNLLQAHD